MQPLGRTVEQVTGEIASRQHGVVARAQLVDAGITPEEIKQRVRKGVLLRIHRGVYRVGHIAHCAEARYLAAILACGPGAVLSGRPAAHLHGLINGSPPPPEVTAPTERRVKGVRCRRYRSLDPSEVTRSNGIPVTTVPRTLVDLAGTLGPNELARACHQATVRFRTSPDAVEAVLSHRPASPGAATLRAVLHGDVKVTLSALERRFLYLLKKAGLPLPETNQRVGGRLVDCRWSQQNVTVELDGYRFHGSRHAW